MVVIGVKIKEPNIRNREDEGGFVEVGEEETVGIFVGEIWVFPPTRIEGVAVGVTFWSIMKVVEGVGLFNSQILE